MPGKRFCTNPFKPTAGMTPPMLIGRESVIDDFIDGLDGGPGAPERLLRITGPRGSGKTVLLTELGNIAGERGWTVVDVSGKEPLCLSIQEQLARDARLKSLDVKISLPFITAEAQLGAAQDISFRSILSRSTRSLSAHGSGLLITVDEAQDASREDMGDIATCVQYMIREQQNIALIFAGISTGVLDMLNGEGVTFLRRAKAEELASIPAEEVADSFRKTIEASGFMIAQDVLEFMAAMTHGYAYLVQLVGYSVWREARRHADASLRITQADAERGCAVAQQDFGASVLETALSGITKPAMEYLLAMTEDTYASSTSVIAKRMGKPASSANTYRRILIERQIIESTAPGYVAFSIPFMKEYLLEHRQELLSRYGG